MIRVLDSAGSTLVEWGRQQQQQPAIPDSHDGIVYRIPCGSCNKVYIGEKGRPCGELILEHRRDVRLMRTDNFTIAEHTYDAYHLPNWSGVLCIAHDRHWFTRRVKETIQIRLHLNIQNRYKGIDIPESWMSTIRRHAQQTKNLNCFR